MTSGWFVIATLVFACLWLTCLVGWLGFCVLEVRRDTRRVRARALGDIDRSVERSARPGRTLGTVDVAERTPIVWLDDYRRHGGGAA